MSWVAAAVIGSAAIGAGVSAYGANRQSQDNRAAQDQNARLQQQQNDASWTNWLMTRGVAPASGTSFTAGTLPGPGQTRAVNTRLPLWANINLPTAAPTAPGAPRVPFLVRKGGT